MSLANSSIPNIDGLCNFTALRRASRYMTAAYDQALAPANLRITQFSILYQLSKAGEMSIGDLAAALAMDRTTLATNLKPLEREGLISVEPGEDRRSKVSKLTRAGVAKFKRAYPLWSEVQAQFESAYGKERAAALRADLRGVLSSGFDPWAEHTEALG